MCQHANASRGNCAIGGLIGGWTMRIIVGASLVLITFLSAGIAAQARDYFGAIAYSPSTGASGYSYDQPSRGHAEGRAMTECRKRSRGCKGAIYFVNGCGAVATGRNGWGSGWGGTRARAEEEAIHSCGRYTGGCGIKTWVCTKRPRR